MTSTPTTSRGKRWRRRLVVYPLLYLLLVGAIQMGCADRLILFPSADPIVLQGISCVTLQGPCGKLDCWTARTPKAAAGEPEAFVLAFIGNADRAEHFAARTTRQWQGHPVEIWAVNYPGYGASEGRARLASIGPSALAAYDAIKARAGDRRIFVQGLSLGTAAALHVAANRPVAGAVLQNPPPLKQLILEKFGWWNLWLVAGPVAWSLPSELDSIANARRVTAPAVFVLAGADEVVPPGFQKRVVDAHAGEHRVVSMPDATHNDLPEGKDLEQLQARIKWMWK
jgi:pimeloyl-ACP methyl ester carboxylesterase